MAIPHQIDPAELRSRLDKTISTLERIDAALCEGLNALETRGPNPLIALAGLSAKLAGEVVESVKS